MLGTMGATLPPTSAKEIAAGLTDEIRIALKEAKQNNAALSEDKLPKIEEALGEIRRTIAAQIVSSRNDRRRPDGTALDQTIMGLPSLARELAYRIRYRHLTRDQYEKLHTDDHLGGAVRAMRNSGILLPLRDHGKEGNVVYWFPPGTADRIRNGLLLSRPQSLEIRNIISKHLELIGYPSVDFEEPPQSDSAKDSH